MGGEGLSPERKSWSAAGHVGRLVGDCFGLVFVVGPMHVRLIVETGRKQGSLLMRSPNSHFQRLRCAPPLNRYVVSERRSGVS